MYTSFFFDPLKGVFEVAGGIGYTIGPPLGGILYEVSSLTLMSLNIIVNNGIVSYSSYCSSFQRSLLIGQTD